MAGGNKSTTTDLSLGVCLLVECWGCGDGLSGGQNGIVELMANIEASTALDLAAS